MSNLGRRVVRQRGFVVALITAASVLVVLVAQNVLTNTFGYLALLSSGTLSGQHWNFLLSPRAFTLDVAFAAGVLVGLWFIAPVASDLRLFHVITRSLLATIVGAVVAGVIDLGIGLFDAFVGPLGAMTGFNGHAAVVASGRAIATAGDYFISEVPLVILAGVLLWIWLERHPRNHQVAGFIDDV